MNNPPTGSAQTILIEPENQLPPFTIDDLPESIRTAAAGLGWNSLMPVQSTAIPYLMADRDMIVQSRTGSGKTGAFMIPLIMKVDTSRKYPQALVLVPTRELASQVYREFEALSAGTGMRGALVYGGVGYGSQFQSLQEGAQVVIGTPGRVLDHLGRRSLNLDRLRVMVFDEADEMLSMGFYPAMLELRRYLPRERRSWMFSATMPYKVQSLAREFLREPEFLSLSAGSEAVSTSEHRYYIVPPMDKDIMLMRLIEMENPESAIIFCNMKSEVEYLSAALLNNGYNADQLSGDLDQKARERAMSRIRTRDTRFLVATDVAARGIDISDLAFVFQHDVPKDPDSYIHRAGRTARAGNTGVVVTLVANMSEKTDIKKIARKYGIEFVELPIPTQEEVEQRIYERMIVLLEDRFREKTGRSQRDRIKRFEPLVKSLADSDDERGLLAMLLDNLYHAEFHAATPAQQATEVPAAAAAAPAPASAPRQDRPSGKEEQRHDRGEPRRDRQGERPERQGDRPERQADRPERHGARSERQAERSERDEPLSEASERPLVALDRQLPQSDQAEPEIERPRVEGEEGAPAKKKKKKRRRNRNRNREGLENREGIESREGTEAREGIETPAQEESVIPTQLPAEKPAPEPVVPAEPIDPAQAEAAARQKELEDYYSYPDELLKAPKRVSSGRAATREREPEEKPSTGPIAATSEETTSAAKGALETPQAVPEKPKRAKRPSKGASATQIDSSGEGIAGNSIDEPAKTTKSATTVPKPKPATKGAGASKKGRTEPAGKEGRGGSKAADGAGAAGSPTETPKPRRKPSASSKKGGASGTE